MRPVNFISCFLPLGLLSLITTLLPDDSLRSSSCYNPFNIGSLSIVFELSLFDPESFVLYCVLALLPLFCAVLTLNDMSKAFSLLISLFSCASPSISSVKISLGLEIAPLTTSFSLMKERSFALVRIAGL